MSGLQVQFPSTPSTWQGDSHGSGQVLLYDASGNALMMKDQAAFTPGTQSGLPSIGQDKGAIARVKRVTRGGEIGIRQPQFLFWDPVEGSTLNTALWTTSTSTMTITQTSGTITLNAGASVTSGAYAILTSQRQIPLVHVGPMVVEFRANIVQKVNEVYELGYGAPTTTATPVANGTFFRINAAGTLQFVFSNGSTETVTALTIVGGSLSSTSYYVFYVSLEDTRAHVIVEDSSGIPVVDQWCAVPVTQGDPWALSHLPIFARAYNNTSPATAGSINIGEVYCYLDNLNTQRNWDTQLSSSAKQALVNPTTFAQTTQLAAAAAPTGFTPSNTAGGNAFLGGEFVVNMSAASESLLSIAAFTIPTPYSFFLRSNLLVPPGITTALGASAYLLEFVLIANCATGNINTGGGFRYPLGFFSATSAQAAGTQFSGNIIFQEPQCPIHCYPGTVLHLAVKVLVGSLATGVYRLLWTPDGYFE
jgi:hypothetical protein